MDPRTIFLPVILVVLSGCQTIDKAAVVAASGTTIGLEIGQTPTGAAPSLKFGYNRAEVAVVSEKGFKQGSDKVDVANVLMELRYSSQKADSPGVYQRLAVGESAVTEVGASVMFAKGPDGTIDDSAAQMLDSFIDRASDADNFDQSNPSDPAPSDPSD